MRFDISRACLLVLCTFATAAIAQDHSAFLKKLDEKSGQMKRCADIARELEKIPVPPKHAEAKTVAATNATLKDAKMRASIDPAHANFENTVKRMDKDFAKCGSVVFQDLAAVESGLKPFMEQVKKEKLAEPEQKAISASLGNYMKAKQNLQEAVELLSKDIQMQAYVEKTLLEHYLNQKY